MSAPTKWEGEAYASWLPHGRWMGATIPMLFDNLNEIPPKPLSQDGDIAVRVRVTIEPIDDTAERAVSQGDNADYSDSAP